ncbi:MAG: GNAT family N-acetyltransferase [Eubacteriales bacterium]|nr:GNAT family N-acetyltransferase [Eubacteriales bacterium]
MLIIRKAKKTEFESIVAFYYKLIDDMQGLEYKPMWKKGIYPSLKMLREELDAGHIYIGIMSLDADEIVACLIANHSCNESYNEIEWPTKAEASEVTVIHALGVAVDHAGQGIAQKMCKHVIEECRAAGQKAIRLDVLTGNKPAEALYPKCGFKSVKKLSMYYEDTGWTNFELFELSL